mgnify:FL=1
MNYHETGRKYAAAAVSEKDGYTSVPLSLPPHTNLFVVFDGKPNAAQISGYSINT